LCVQIDEIAIIAHIDKDFFSIMKASFLSKMPNSSKSAIICHKPGFSISRNPD
jgi:hypothetical protein